MRRSESISPRGVVTLNLDPSGSKAFPSGKDRAMQELIDKIKTMDKQPVELSTVAFGRKDRELGRFVCRMIENAMPSTEIPWQRNQHVHLSGQKVEKRTWAWVLLWSVILATLLGAVYQAKSEPTPPQIMEFSR